MKTKEVKVVIESLIDAHDQLYALAVKKLEAIKIGDHHAVNELVIQEKPLIKSLARLESQREQLIKQSALELNMGERVSFSEWITLVSMNEEDKAMWDALHLRLAESVFNLKQANDLNQEMLRQSLQWIQLNLNLLQKKPKYSNYNKPSRRSAYQPTLSRIDSRA
ncbi:flagellar protein FlgN [Terrilactibacillus laevilacticus]|uniref:Flagellar protein FlgN n=1 Tax=Terrilactibacillus laevilacticus TaxID=1380157 RepID=A0ABW5PMX0_9BACI|nr:flagellar protein FlgN [Terrilactibacillus laevilacticus]